MEENSILEIVNLKKTFGLMDKNKTIIWENLTFSVQKNTIHGLLGKNGVGKTTLIKTIIGALQVIDGTIKINNVSHTDFQKRSKINYMPEALDMNLSGNIFNSVRSVFILNGYKLKESKIKTIELLTKINLLDKRKLNFSKLSSGQKQKLILNTMLIANSEIKLLILDEPAANLDPTERKIMFDKIISLKQEGYTIIISSHILSEIKDIVDNVTILHNKKISFSGSIQGIDLEELWFENTKE